MRKGPILFRLYNIHWSRVTSSMDICVQKYITTLLLGIQDVEVTGAS